MSIFRGKAALNSRTSIVRVDVSKCCDWQCYSYSSEGWHYLTAVLKQFINNPALDYQSSVLKKYYDLYQPKSLMECLFYGEGYKRLRTPWSPLPWRPNTKWMTGENQHFGPNSDEFGEKEFLRVVSIYKKLKEDGYLPEENEDGYIRGQFLKKGEDYRFLAGGGQHRLAALSVLGIQTVSVKLQPHWVRVVNPNEVDTWFQVRNKTYDQETALRIFTNYFENNGIEKAGRIGLLE
ncbi:hypothetical protein LF817_01195 [Halobacillus sp. A1]|uniref:hypothetical protein n=1 Tax=Halobacillus sp. A1 TaxID=2880262 RepID=UPI0020A681D2|nr:hypothetical protein [Halobacillus sp. A1]MCP3029947.1 hypothetical protein [Halobacillus sp. A1]